MNTHVVYTAIFGGYDRLIEPKVRPDGFDFVCFSDRELHSSVWEVRVVAPAYDDATRNARMYKILPHRYLGSYETSVWVDGNIFIHGDVADAVDRYLSDAHIAMYDHAYARHQDREQTPNVRASLHDELDALLQLAARGRVKDDPMVMRTQVERYKKEGYSGKRTALTNTIFRKHNEADVQKAMECWWAEVRNGSKRDQLSFPYALWKTGLAVHWIEENARENEFFSVKKHGL